MQNYTLKSHKGKFILLATILASGMAFLLGTMVSIALPTVQNYFSASISQMQWVLNAYVLALAVLLLLAGSLSDYFGTKKVFLTGIFVFTAGSFFSAMAQSTTQLIAFQAFQGIGGALMIPGSLSIINTNFSEKVRGAAIGYWAGLAGAMAAFGPFLGGWLVQNFNWQSVFWFNVPIGVVVFLVALKFVPKSKTQREEKLNIKSAFLLGLTLFGISFALIQGPALGWGSKYIIAAILGGIFSLALFVVWEKNSTAPLMPLEVFKNKMVLGANLSTLLLYFGLNGAIIFMVFNLQQAQGYSPVKTGLALLPLTLIITFFSGAGGKITDKIGPRFQTITAPILVAFGIGFLLRLPQDANFWVDIFPSFLFIGAGMAFVIAAITKSALSVKPQHSGAASGINNAASRIAALLAFAVLALPFAIYIYTAFTFLAAVAAYVFIKKEPKEKTTESLHHMHHH